MTNLSLLDISLKLPLKDPVPIFSLVLFIVLLAPIVLRKFRIPSIIGLILAGVAIGDHGFDLIEKGSIDLFGRAGLLYIMFLAGLELDMNEFRENRNRSALFGILTFCIPFGLGLLVCHYILHFNFVGSLLVSSMFSTHTLVAYPIASRLGITKNEAVTITVGGTIITDSAVLLILAVITGYGKGQLGQGFWIQLGVSIAIFTAVVLWGFPWLGRWFFKKIKDDKVTHFIFVFAMVFLAAFLAEMAGVDAIIGAFLAGLALNRLIPTTSPLMNRIEFVGNAIFIPFFLISVGMLVDLHILLKGPTALMIAGILTAVALCGKWIAAWLTQHFFRYTATQRNVIFGLSGAHAAATIAVILIGYNMKIVDENVLNGTVILILITCMVASFVESNAGTRLAVAEAEAKPDLSTGPEKILLPVLSPARAEELLDFAVMIKENSLDTPIVSLVVVKDDDEAREKIILSNRVQEETVARASATENEVQTITRIDLNVVDGIARTVKELGITDVVLDWEEKASTTERLFGTLFGTTQENILSSVRETIYSCLFHAPLNTTGKVYVLAGRNAEYEVGFSHWMHKVLRLCKETGARLVLCCPKRTYLACEAFIEGAQVALDYDQMLVEDPDDLVHTLEGRVSGIDLLVLISARKGTLSFQHYMENAPARLQRHFPASNIILIYPEQNEAEAFEPGIRSEDLTLTPIQDQIENFNRLGRMVKRFFKGKR
ncbi:MAG TPA: cation:proton antiporter [Dinghuibacter sp.]|jgi:Kef-type K+ transport system membrane component KefB|uniref:cation:proton antiporter n=1 Tax=Dinghuibacter sp. TaxID=2024697 RepID=UPI002B6A7029|nr:cation:proton antiporter [Dinghuibacter sp.]HTJ12129.1 cation:proton antiporter [Dinghuibacter sp.]